MTWRLVFFGDIIAGDEPWFHYRDESSAMFAKSPGDVIPRARKEVGAKQTMLTIFFTNRKLLITECLPRSQKYNQDYFVSDILPEMEREKLIYEGRKQGGTFCINGSLKKS
jgi:hypothetical protein